MTGISQTGQTDFPLSTYLADYNPVNPFFMDRRTFDFDLSIQGALEAPKTFPVQRSNRLMQPLGI